MKLVKTAIQLVEHLIYDSLIECNSYWLKWQDGDEIDDVVSAQIYVNDW